MERSAYKCVDIADLIGAFRNGPLQIETNSEKWRKVLTRMKWEKSAWEYISRGEKMGLATCITTFSVINQTS